MFNRFVRSARGVAEEAGAAARELGSPTVEAEHVLLAVARRDPAARDVLAEADVDEAGMLEALEAEMRASLAAVGIRDVDVETRFSPAPQVPRWATSAKAVLEGSLQVALDRGDTRIGPGHILVSALSMTHGTVPRALEAAGVDRLALARRAGAALES